MLVSLGVKCQEVYNLLSNDSSKKISVSLFLQIDEANVAK